MEQTDEPDQEPPMDIQRKKFNEDKADTLARYVHRTVYDMLEDYRKEVDSLERSVQDLYVRNREQNKELKELKAKLKELAK